MRLFRRKETASTPASPGPAGIAVDVAIEARDVPQLIDIVRHDPALSARRQAAVALGEIGDASAVLPLIEVLQCTDDAVPEGSYPGEAGAVRRAAATALGEIGDPRAVEPLIAAMRGDYAVCDQAASALARLDDERAVGPLLDALQNPQTYSYGPSVEQVADWLHGRGDERVKPALLTGYEEAFDKSHYATAMAQLGGDDVFEFFVSRLSGEAPEPVAHGLVLLGDVRAVEPLAQTFRESLGYSGRLDSLADALVAFREPGIQAMVDAIPEGGGSMRDAAATALERVADPRSVEIAIPDPVERARLSHLGTVFEAVDYSNASLAELTQMLREQFAWMSQNETRYDDLRVEFKVRETPIVAVGQELYRRGGERLMREVHGQVPRDYQRLLERQWAGIGGWLG